MVVKTVFILTDPKYACLEAFRYIRSWSITIRQHDKTIISIFMSEVYRLLK
jgi:hypothetical protein